MKRTALVLLTAIYLLSSVGIGVNHFYCCGKLASVTLTYATADHTDNTGNCCKHESKSFKVKDTHINTTSFALSVLSPVIIPSLSTWSVIIPVNEQRVSIGYQNHAPPGNLPIPIYKLNCAYRI